MTFAVLGLLLGLAESYGDTEPQMKIRIDPERLVLDPLDAGFEDMEENGSPDV